MYSFLSARAASSAMRSSSLHLSRTAQRQRMRLAMRFASNTGMLTKIAAITWVEVSFMLQTLHIEALDDGQRLSLAGIGVCVRGQRFCASICVLCAKRLPLLCRHAYYDVKLPSYVLTGGCAATAGFLPLAELW